MKALQGYSRLDGKGHSLKGKEGELARIEGGNREARQEKVLARVVRVEGRIVRVRQGLLGS